MQTVNTVKIKNIMLGEGCPKICVPLVAKDEIALQQQLAALTDQPFDLVEFRADFLQEIENIDFALKCCDIIRNALPQTPLLFTFRRAEEGGEHAVSSEQYFSLLQAVIQSGKADVVDIELFAGDDQVKAITALAKQYGVVALLCNHDFEKTPPKEEIVNRLQKMQDLGADICKIAVMPQSAADVITLLDATQTMFNQYARCPLITMAMGRLGVMSRLSGETFGSAMTFGAAAKASAPGQIAVGDLRLILDILSNK